jgi:hypothetical protein
VITDGSAILSGDFIAETDIQYAVMGCFTPGFVPAVDDKLIYEYDDVEITVVSESSINIPPAKTDNEEFYIARARTVGATIELQDKRTEFWETKAEYELYLMTILSNPIIGIESVKWDLTTTPRNLNEVNISWGYRSTNWSVDTSRNIVTINSGLGGILKENVITNFVNGMFNGWRLYTKTGKYFIIISSVKSGTQLNIKLDYLNYDDFDVSGDLNEIHIVPNAEEIEIRANYDSAIGINEKLEQRFLFPIHYSVGKIYLRIYNAETAYKYNLTYRYKNVKQYTGWQVFPNDATGYYSELSFDEFGVLNTNLIDRELKPYNGSATLGFCELVPHESNWNILFGELITGDIYGIEHRAMTNAVPVVDLVVGVNKQHQVLTFTSLTLSNDMYINLSKIRSDDTACINGNRFIVQIEGVFDLNGNTLKIVTDYVNTSSYTLVREIELKDQYFITQNQRIQRSGLVMIFTYDGTDWWLSISNEMNGVPVGTIVAYAGSAANFDSTGLGITGDVLGWALCNGETQAGIVTKNLKGRVIIGVDLDDPEYDEGDRTGGAKTSTIGNTNLPLHNHAISVTSGGESGHTHPIGPFYEDTPGAFLHHKVVYDPATSGDLFVADTGASTGHTHAITGNTNDGGGQTTPVGLEVRQPWITQLYIQKVI